MSLLLNVGELGICGLWSYWKPLWLIFESVIHGYEFCIFFSRPLLESCVHCIMSILFLDVDHLPREPVGRWVTNYIWHNSQVPEKVLISKEYQEWPLFNCRDDLSPVRCHFKLCIFHHLVISAMNKDPRFTQACLFSVPKSWVHLFKWQKPVRPRELLCCLGVSLKKKTPTHWGLNNNTVYTNICCVVISSAFVTLAVLTKSIIEKPIIKSCL